MNLAYYLIIGERMEQQILDTEPYLNQNRGKTRHTRGPVYDSSISFMKVSKIVSGDLEALSSWWVSLNPILLDCLVQRSPICFIQKNVKFQS